MKVSKHNRAIKACDDVATAVPGVDVETSVSVLTDCPYAQARCFIQSAISALTEVASTDDIAKESIANLAVVLFDLDK